MHIFPAIDMKDGACVRLQKGEFDTVHRVADDAVETALRFKRAGASFLHMVDLDGARDGKRKNRESLFRTAAAFDGFVELGGGIRTLDDVRDCLENGISRVILGSAALKNRPFVRECVERYGERVAVGIDAKEGYVSVSGWVEQSDVHYLDFAKLCEADGVQYLIYTDIARDGLLSGPDLEGLKRLSGAVSCGITASGGVKDIDDIRALAALGLYGAICGKSIYANTLDLAEAVACTAASRPEKGGK